MALMRRETSTRSAAIIRIGLVGIIWARHGDDFMLFRDMHLKGLAIAAVFYASTFLMLFGVFRRRVRFEASRQSECPSSASRSIGSSVPSGSTSKYCTRQMSTPK